MGLTHFYTPQLRRIFFLLPSRLFISEPLALPTLPKLFKLLTSSTCTCFLLLLSKNPTYTTNMHAKTTIGATIALLLNAIAVNAFHVESRISCDTVGAACQYVSDDSSAGGSSSTIVNGFCASDNVCASNGATCSSDDNCYNYCGTDGICGGEGAGCNTQSTFEAGQTGIACGSDFTCSAHDSVGKCEAAATAAAPGASQANTRRFKRRMNDSALHARQVRSSDLRA